MKYIILALFSTFSIEASQIYIDTADLEISEDVFYIHQGENLYKQTNSVYTDTHGLYYIEEKNPKEQKWKCPYCHRYWPVGQKCQNSQCPSKY